MTTLSVHTGLIRFHVNLRDPEGSSVPVAAFSLCQLDGEVFGALVVARPALRAELSPAASRMLRLMPATVRLQIDRLIREEGAGELADVMRKLQASFMNSLFVEQVLLHQPVQAADAEAPEAAVVRHTRTTLQRAQRPPLPSTAAGAEAPARSTAAPWELERPESSSWWPGRPGDVGELPAAR
jgi:hypothetical protein